MHHVILTPISPTHYESEYWNVYRNIRRREILLWCEDLGLTEGQDFKYEFMKCVVDGDHAHVLSFDKISNAVLYKLTWGGKHFVPS